jgi:hypothetical protein
MTYYCYLASTVSQNVGAGFFFGGVGLAIISVIVAIILACTNRPKKWTEALLFGIGLPIVFLGIAFAGCAAAMSS